MNVRRRRWLRGANVWAACPVLELVLDLGDAGAWAPERVRQTAARLAVGLPGAPAADGDGDLPGLARAFGRAALQLQNLAGMPVAFTAAQATGQGGLFLVAVESVAETVGQAAADSALRLLRAAAEGQSLPLDDDLRRLRELNDARFPPNGQAGVIAAGARALGVPVARLHPEYRGYLRLGQGSKQQRCRGCEPNLIGAVARMASTDKYLTKHLLREAGVPVPEGRLVSSAEDAWAAACELGLPVATKPQDSFLATGVSLDLRTREQVEAGFRAAREHSDDVLVERFAPGLEHRVLVVGGRVSAVARIEPPHVVGDGTATVAELVARVNADPRRGDEDSDRPLRLIELDAEAEAVLAGQGYTLNSVPPAGQWVLVRRNPPYICHGGNLIDLTDRIHPANAAHAVAAAQALQVMVAGLDVVALDIGRPLEEQGGVVVEINVSPGLWLHLAPWSDSPRPVGEDIVRAMFPPGGDGRIPVVAMLGDDDGATRRHLAALLARAGLRMGFCGEAVVEVGGRRWAPPPGGPQERAGVLTQHTGVDVAVLETNPEELVRAGFGNDRCDAAILLGALPADIADDDLGPPVRAFVDVLRNALTPNGAFVVPAGSESARLEGVPPERVMLVARRGELGPVRRHVAAGGRALAVADGAIVLEQPGQAPRPLGKLPEALADAETTALLAAVASGLALGHGADVLSTYLALSNASPGFSS